MLTRTVLPRIIDSVLAYGLVISNMVLVVLLWGVLKVSPSDVLNEVTIFRDESTSRYNELGNRLQQMDDELQRRAIWMEEIDSELVARAKDQIFRKDFAKWRKKAQEYNPRLQLPTFEEIENIGATGAIPESQPTLTQ